MRAINVDGTDHVLGLALELGVPRAVYVSTVFALGETGSQIRDETFERATPCRSQYESTKTEAHALALEYQRRGLALIIACPNGVIGPDDHSVWGYFLRLYINRLMPPVAWAPDAVFSLVHVEDLAAGLALAAERGRPGDQYFLCGEPCSVRHHLGCWRQRPGAMAVRVWVPPALARWACWPVEPFQRMAGLPAFLSRETVTASAGSLHYSGAKARRELGWTHRTAERMWLDTIDGEMELLRRRTRRDLRSRLRPAGPGLA
jgi:dihydroflavonol-4-reductase